MDEYKRLHITPLTPTLLKTIIPPSVQPYSRNISYHTIQTFPEKSYGYVDLPLHEAERLKNKFHGCIIQGTKIRIQMARPIPVHELEPEPAMPQVERSERKKKKRQRNELPGVEIGERRVKRGWTTPAQELKKTIVSSDKPVVKSKYTTGAECLFKTVLPPNVASNSKFSESKPKKKKKRGGKEAVVHEFANTTKYATFLKDKSGAHDSRTVNKFVEEVGWVDEHGDLVEKVNKRKKSPKDVPKVKKAQLLEPVAQLKRQDFKNESAEMELDKENSNSLSGSETSDEYSKRTSRSSILSSESEENGKSVEPSITQTTISDAYEFSDASSSSSSSSFSPSSSSSKSDNNKAVSNKQASVSTKRSVIEGEGSSDPPSSQEAPSKNEKTKDKGRTAIFSPSRPQISPSTPLSIQIPPGFSQHPLEALFKKSETVTPSQKPSGFKFFAADSEDVCDDPSTSTIQYDMTMPLTPFTKREIEHRIIRSAAPTPDTAHTNKRFVWPPRNDDDISGEDDKNIEKREPDNQGSHHATPRTGVLSSAPNDIDFQAWFWEQRGTLNRSWKKRRKSVLKEQRQRDNRKKP